MKNWQIFYLLTVKIFPQEVWLMHYHWVVYFNDNDWLRAHIIVWKSFDSWYDLLVRFVLHKNHISTSKFSSVKFVLCGILLTVSILLRLENEYPCSLLKILAGFDFSLLPLSPLLSCELNNAIDCTSKSFNILHVAN